MGRTYPRREITARKEYFAQTDEVIGLFTRPIEQAQAGMKSSVLWEREAPKAVKLYDAETGPTAALATNEEEYPCLRLVGLGFLSAMALCLFAMWIAGIIV